MGRKPKTPNVDVVQWFMNKIRLRGIYGLDWLLQSLAEIDVARRNKDASEAVLALHSLHSLRRAQTSDSFHEDKWREFARSKGETVEIPAVWADALAEAWGEYLTSDTEPSFVKAFGAHQIKGLRSDARTATKTLMLHWDIAREVKRERLANLARPEPISMEEIFGRVAEQFTHEDFGVRTSERTVKRAWAYFGDLLDSLTELEARPPQ